MSVHESGDQGPAAMPTTMRPPTIQRVPVAPSTARFERLRRPIIIMIAHAMRPMMPR